ncbi:MAG: thioredoxin family protein [Bacteroidales bacterium]|nr:thioredoxin family protein [Bacteroidales bacterium]
MKRLIMTILASAVMCFAAEAQSNLKKVYDETIDPMTQIDNAIAKADKNGKFVICQVGGNWCRWCLMFADYITKDSEISALIDKNFEYIHVNYNPRERSDETKMKKAEEMLERLGNPGRFGYPVFVVLDGDGKVIHIQDSSLLEEGNGYNKSKVMRFFSNWTPEAVK